MRNHQEDKPKYERFPSRREREEMKQELIAAGEDPEAVADAAAEEYVRKYQSLLCCLSAVRPEQPKWLWYPYIPRGKVTIVMGDPGEGKTTLMLFAGAMLSRGVLLDGSEGMPENVIFQSAEDGLGDTIVPRLMAMGANMANFHSIRDEEDMLTFDDNRLESAVNMLDASLCVLDPIQAYLGEHVDMHRANEVRPKMKALADIAARTGCAIVLIAHMNKMSGIKAMYKILGSIDIAAAARSVLLVLKDPNEPDLIVVKQVKNSLAAIPEAIAFRREKNGYALTFEGEYEGDAEELMDKTNRTPSLTRQAEAFLTEALAGGERLSSEVIEEAKARGLGTHAVMNARKHLGVVSRKGSDMKWRMSLPESRFSKAPLLPQEPVQNGAPPVPPPKPLTPDDPAYYLDPPPEPEDTEWYF